jgi:predicted DCC family thiol-disulfide oxidoreductase YuxK
MTRLVSRRDPQGRFRMEPLQSEAGRALLARHGVPETIDSLVLIEGDRAYTHSHAALRVTRRLGGPWRLTGALLLLPRTFRDALYRWVARNRHRWFGQVDAPD